MTTGSHIKAARGRYGKSEWQHMTGIIAPMVPNQWNALEEQRDEIVEGMASNLEMVTLHLVRMHSYITDAERDAPSWVHDWFNETKQACNLEHDTHELARMFSDAYFNGGVHGPAMTVVLNTEYACSDAAKAYIYYVEDLFDDVVAAIEWQLQALADD